ncbi:MAG: ABC transporter ATP-binding protein, partial [Acidobacteria bacterium]
CHSIVLEKDMSETRIVDQSLLEAPAWRWPER